MAFSLNRAQVIGNVTRDPEVKQTGQGQMVVNFSVATSQVWNDAATGQKKEKTEFHNVVVWRKLAEICAQYVRKGLKIFVEGKLQTRDWTGDDGVKRYRTEIVADNVIIMTPRSSMSGGMPTGVNLGAAMPTETREAAGIGEPSIAEPSPDMLDGAKAGASADDITIEDLPF